MVSFNAATTSPSERHDYHPHFADDKAEAQGRERICPSHTAGRWQNQDSNQVCLALKFTLSWLHHVPSSLLAL